MKSMLRLALLWAVVAFLTTAAFGCVVTVEPLVRFEGSDINDSGAYEPGDNILVRNSNGQIELVPGSSATEIRVTFKPFSMRADSEESQAKSDMEDDLNVVVDDTVDPILIRAYRDEGSSGNLGADIVVELPSGFDGGIEIESGNGSIDANLTGGLPAYTTVDSDNGGVDLVGAAGPLNIEIDNGDSTIGVQAWSAADGHVHIGLGDLGFTVAAGQSGRILATAGDPGDGTVLGPSPLPADWTETELADNSKSFEFGGDPASGGLVTLTADFFTAAVTIDQR